MPPPVIRREDLTVSACKAVSKVPKTVESSCLDYLALFRDCIAAGKPPVAVQEITRPFQ